jgi:hypothetical protein
VIANELRRWNAVLVAGMVLATGPALGVLGTVAGMLHSYHTINTMKAPTPGDLSVDAQFGMISSVVGYLAGLVGIPLIVVACIRIARIREQELSENVAP